MPRLHAALLLAAWLPCAPAAAATDAVLPLLGQELTVVTVSANTPSRLDRNAYDTVLLKEPVFERPVLLAVERALRSAGRNDQVVMLRGDAAAAAPLIADESEAGLRALVDAVKPAAAAVNAELLLLVVPHRAQPWLTEERGHRGSGSAAGLGLYINRIDRMRRLDTGENAVGYLGLFANFRVLLIDVSSGAILANETATVGTTRSAARAPDADPANALSDADKLTVLRNLLGNELVRLLPGMLAKAPR